LFQICVFHRARARTRAQRSGARARNGPKSVLKRVPRPSSGERAHHLSRLESRAAAGGMSFFEPRMNTDGHGLLVRWCWMEPRKTRKEGWGRREWFGVGFSTTDEHGWARILGKDLGFGPLPLTPLPRRGRRGLDGGTVLVFNYG
jgi:hypothetical protein